MHTFPLLEDADSMMQCINQNFQMKDGQLLHLTFGDIFNLKHLFGILEDSEMLRILSEGNGTQDGSIKSQRGGGACCKCSLWQKKIGEEIYKDCDT